MVSSRPVTTAQMPGVGSRDTPRIAGMTNGVRSTMDWLVVDRVATRTAAIITTDPAMNRRGQRPRTRK